MLDKTEEELRSIFDFYDKNADSYISRGEFVDLVEDVFMVSGNGFSKKIFSDADLNRDNKISFEEFLVLIKNI